MRTRLVGCAAVVAVVALILWRLRRAAEGETPSPPRREPTRRELYEEARRLGIPGRSKMNKEELRRAVENAR